MNDFEQSRSRSESITVWTGILLPAALWGLQMQINYSLVRMACSAQRNMILYLTTLIALLLTIGAGLLNFSRKPASVKSNKADESSMATFLWMLALFSSGGFSVVIIAQFLSEIFFHPCQL